MVRQRILLSGKFAHQQERNSGVGYIYDFETAADTDIKSTTSSITQGDLSALIELGHREAVSICKEILHLRIVDKFPIKLAPLESQASRKETATKSSDGDSESDEESDSESDDVVDEVEVIETGEVKELAAVIPTGSNHEVRKLASFTAAAAFEVGRLGTLCNDYKQAVDELEAVQLPGNTAIANNSKLEVPSSSDSQPATQPSTPSHPLTAAVPSKTYTSQMLDDNGLPSIQRIRQRLQAPTTTKSERVVQVDPKFSPSLLEFNNSEANVLGEKISTKEAAQRVRVQQDLNTELKKQEQRKTRELRWKSVAAIITNLSLVKDGEHLVDWLI